MLESLIYQTKQPEQTNISLEEAKLEITTLWQANKGLEAASAMRRGGVEQRSVRDLLFGGAEEEIRVLRGEVRAAMQGEERNRKAPMPRPRVLAWAEARLRALSNEHDRCRLEAEECAAAWGDKERVFLDCVRASEEEVNRARQENTKFVELQRVMRDENARLREILKQAVAEANVVKYSLELARAENARLNNAVANKDATLQGLRQEYEYECVKVRQEYEHA
ncbi:hypothetical protein BAE44_0014326 [Dichanthelium oligosanthes]|uniref:Uncharacterized protein n=1 Tax=Dichanthelium oligosanthes TaxID=888268 RepID=A0A1E5VHV5_9POAL|nr:hypothetical protein BAE44_0014326 [Dichanthelium oligosanthes]